MGKNKLTKMRTSNKGQVVGAKEAKAQRGIVKPKEELSLGDVCEATVLSVKPLQIQVALPGGSTGRIHVSEFTDVIKQQGAHPGKYVKQGEKIQVVILGWHLAAKKKSLAISHPRKTQIYDCSSRLSVIAEKKVVKPVLQEGDKVPVYVKGYEYPYLSVFINHISMGRIHYLNLSRKKNVIRKASTHFEAGNGYVANVLKVGKGDIYDLALIENVDIHPANHIMGVVLSSSVKKGLVLSLPLGYKGYVSLTEISDEYKPLDQMFSAVQDKTLLSCYVLSCDNSKKQATLSLRDSRLKTPKDGILTIPDREITQISDIHNDDQLHGFIQVSHHGLTITLGQNVTAYVGRAEMEAEDSALMDGDIVRVRVISVSSKENKLKVKIIGRELSGTRETKQVVVKRRRTESENEEQEIKKLLKQESASLGFGSQSNPLASDGGSGIIERLKVLSYGKKKKTDETVESGKRLNLSTGFSFQSQKQIELPKKEAAVSDDSEDEEHAGTSKKKMVASKIEEQQLFEQEKAMMTGEQVPDSIDAFDRLVLASPNSSMIWLQYMAFHLKSAEVDKARAVAQRALETINYREESEKLNVWVALLNLENMYGSPDDINSTFQKALQYNDQLKVYRSMASIYEKSSKLRHAEEMHKVMSKKFKFDPEVWINFGLFYMRTHQSNQARNLLQRCSQVLTKKEYVYIVTRYADMEYRFGDPDRGRNMFETLLSNFPKRTDIWLVYIDKLLKSGNVEGARWVCERAVTLRLAPRKIRILFKKYIEVERRFGSASTVEAVQKKAVQYVQEVIESHK